MSATTVRKEVLLYCWKIPWHTHHVSSKLWIENAPFQSCLELQIEPYVPLQTEAVLDIFANAFCYLVPGQKQWKVIDVKGVWGRLRDPASARVLSPAVQPKGPAVQILGKERAPQVDNAASAIATQLEGGMEHDISGSNPAELANVSFSAAIWVVTQCFL